MHLVTESPGESDVVRVRRLQCLPHTLPEAPSPPAQEAALAQHTTGQAQVPGLPAKSKCPGSRPAPALPSATAHKAHHYSVPKRSRVLPACPGDVSTLHPCQKSLPGALHRHTHMLINTLTHHRHTLCHTHIHTSTHGHTYTHHTHTEAGTSRFTLLDVSVLCNAGISGVHGHLHRKKAIPFQ